MSKQEVFWAKQKVLQNLKNYRDLERLKDKFLNLIIKVQK